MRPKDLGSIRASWWVGEGNKRRKSYVFGNAAIFTVTQPSDGWNSRRDHRNRRINVDAREYGCGSAWKK
jgi:hypothetical protein